MLTPPRRPLYDKRRWHARVRMGKPNSTLQQTYPNIIIALGPGPLVGLQVLQALSSTRAAIDAWQGLKPYNRIMQMWFVACRKLMRGEGSCPYACARAGAMRLLSYKILLIRQGREGVSTRACVYSTRALHCIACACGLLCCARRACPTAVYRRSGSDVRRALVLVDLLPRGAGSRSSARGARLIISIRSIESQNHCRKPYYIHSPLS